MTKSDDQEKLSENKFFYDSEINFKVQARASKLFEARASKLFGLWAADKLGLVGKDAEKYALKAVNIKVQAAGFTDVIGKIADDLSLRNIHISRYLLEVEMQKALNAAS